MDRMQHISHPDHDHMLVLLDQWTETDHEQKQPFDCKVCSKPISPGSACYICENSDCKFMLHESCSKLPGEATLLVNGADAVATLESETEQKLEANEKVVNENDHEITNLATKSGNIETEEKDEKKNGETSNVEANDGHESKREQNFQHPPVSSSKVEDAEKSGNNLVKTKPIAKNKSEQLHQGNQENNSSEDEFDDESEDESTKKSTPDDSRFSDLGGMRSVLEELKMEIMVRLNNPLLLGNLGINPVSGILLHGPPGCGKTKLAHAIANETTLPFHYISSAKLDLRSRSTENKVQKLFEEAYKTTPSIVFIDEIDEIANPYEQSLMTQLLTCMDESNSNYSDSTPGYVIVIGATSNPAALGSEFRKPGRFDREIIIGFPDENARVEILSVLTRNLSLEGSLDLVKLSKLTPSFVGADLEKLVNKARSLAIKRIIDQRKSDMPTDSKSKEHVDEWWKQPSWQPKLEETENPSIHMADFEQAVKMMQPASENILSSDGPRFSDFGGIKNVLEELKREVIVHQSNPLLLHKLGIKPVSGILLHGPPGCGMLKVMHGGGSLP